MDYTGFSDASRASIQMTHSAFGPTVSFEEAQRIERETAKHLLKSRKLSLIVDLDQTIVHATVDPTVGDWITEGEAWEARQPNDDPEDECNPNWEALKDVKQFRLGPESFGPPRAQKGKGKNKLVENEGCMYYIKPRPGWKEFLREAATKYEMHVYTMGTRAYAEEVCAAIDPDGSIFGGRLLSRDESGSEFRRFVLYIMLTCFRSNSKESAKIVPLRHIYGSYYRRSCRCLGMEPESR